MTHEEANKLIETIRQFVSDPLAVEAKGRAASAGRKILAQAVDGSTLVRQMPSDPRVSQKGSTIDRPLTVSLSSEVVDAADDVKRFERFKKWLLDDLREDPVFVRLLAQRPELVVEFTPRRVTLQGDTLRGRLARLIAQGWFATTRAVGTCRTELKRTGADPGGGGNLADALNGFVKDGFLTRDGDGYILAPDVKITEKELVSE